MWKYAIRGVRDVPLRRDDFRPKGSGAGQDRGHYQAVRTSAQRAALAMHGKDQQADSGLRVPV